MFSLTKSCCSLGSANEWERSEIKMCAEGFRDDSER